MKKSFSIIITIVLFNLSFSVQPPESEHFYYYFDEKIYLQQAMDQILIKFATNANREQLLAIVDSDASLQPTAKCYLDEDSPLGIAVLEAKDGNPVSDILTVELNPQVSSAIGATNVPVYDVRLFDGQGNLLRQRKANGGTVQFNVSALPNGFYYLHIYDGVSDEPEKWQIVVEH